MRLSATLLFSFLFAVPLCSQQKQPEKPKYILAFSRPWVGCVEVDPPRENYGPGEWSCPPKGQTVVRIEKPKRERGRND